MSGPKTIFMAKTIKSKVDYQVTELVNNLNEAATSTSEQKRDFFTTRALYNAKRLSTVLSKAKIGAMAIAMMFTIASCGASTSSEVSDSTAVAVDTVVVDTVANASVDTVAAPAEGGSGNAESLQPIK
jgi:hypothetical protein